MLIIMKHGDAHPVAQFTFNDKALGCLDIFEVDPAKGRLKSCNNFNEFVGVLFIDLNIKDIDARKFFKQNCFAFHHRL